MAMLMAEFPGAAPPPAGYTPNLANPPDILHTVNTIAMSFAISVVMPFVFMRFCIKVVTTKSFNVEDFFHVLSSLTFLGYWICGILMNFYGAGYHLWDISKDSAANFQQASYASSILYSLSSYFTTTTLLILFIRVFAQFRKTVIFIWITMAIMLLSSITMAIINIRICSPISALWNPQISHACLNRQATFITDTILSALTDLVILIPPIPITLTLHLPLCKKLRIMLLLGAGGLATATSFMRLVFVSRPGSFKDSTVSFVRFNLLGISEVGIGLICASLPALNMLLIRRQSKRCLQRSPEHPHGHYLFSTLTRYPGRHHGSEIGDLRLSTLKSRTLSEISEESAGPYSGEDRARETLGIETCEHILEGNGQVEEIDITNMRDLEHGDGARNGGLGMGLGNESLRSLRWLGPYVINLEKEGKG